MSKEVFLRIKANNVSSTCRSVNVSRLAVGSSKIRIGASLMMARAIASPLAFASAQSQSLLADQCIVAFGQSHDKVMDLRGACCRLDFFSCDSSTRHAQIFIDGCVEEIGILRNVSDLFADFIRRVRFERLSTQTDFSRTRNPKNLSNKFASVLFPAPLGPTIAMELPGLILKLIC